MKIKRCRLNKKWLGQVYQKKAEVERQRIGSIVGESRNGLSWIVKWDDLKTPQNYHKSFISIVRK